MEISTKFKSIFFKSFLSLCFILPLSVSCTDIKELWNEVDDIKERLDSLEKGLNSQIEAMSALIEGGDITIAKCTQNENGSYTIRLSNGTEFTVLHKNAGSKPLLSYVVENNTKYWAIYDADGVLTPLTDGAGKKIPVSAVPTVVEKDGAYYLVIDGNEYITGYIKGDNVSVITDYVVNTDESGNIYSVTFTIGGETFTISVDGYKGFTFMLGSALVGGTIIKDLYVVNDSTYQITAGLDGVVDYVMQIPDGWRINETTDETTGELLLNITAPSKANVISGAAVDSGDLKVVAVVEGGDAMVAKLELSTEPFKTFKVTATNVIIEKYNGVDKYLYGVVKASEYDKDALFANADSMLAANDKGVSETDIDELIEDILGSEVAAGEKYVLWAIPAFYKDSATDAAYHVIDDLIIAQEFGGTIVKQELSDVLFNDATLNFSLSGTDSYYGGTCELTDNAITEIFFRINNGMDEPLTAPMTYTGSVFDFPNADAAAGVVVKSNTTYITWVIPCIEGRKTYSAEDMVSKEFTLPQVTSGGEIQVTAGTAEVDKVSISVPLTAEGASRIYYIFMAKRTANRYTDDTARAAYLLSSGKVIDGDHAVAETMNLSPNSERVMFAMATDATGKYGPILIQNFITDELIYNDVTLTLNVSNVGQNVASVDVTSSSDDVEYVYWAGKQTEEFWLQLSGSNANEKAQYAQEMLALYPDSDAVRRSMTMFPLTDGTINMTDLKGNTIYQVVVVAKDTEGKYSKVGHTQFTTLSVNLGTIVTSDTDAWKNAKNQVLINWHQDKFRSAENSNMSAFYAFDIKVPTNLTAYILCMTDDYFKENPEINTLEDKIIDIEAQCSRKYDAGKVTYGQDGEYALEPDWIDDNGNLHEGQLLNVYDFYVHGYPTNGFATYFATGSHGADNCTEWEAGECSNYAYALNHITKRLSVDYYKEFFREQKGLKVESVIEKAAQDYFEAYYPYYKDAKPLIYENNGEGLYMENHYASGPNDQNVVPDDVFVVFKDADGNYYEPMGFEVPNYFK